MSGIAWLSTCLCQVFSIVALHLRVYMYRALRSLLRKKVCRLTASFCTRSGLTGKSGTNSSHLDMSGTIFAFMEKHALDMHVHVNMQTYILRWHSVLSCLKTAPKLYIYVMHACYCHKLSYIYTYSSYNLNCYTYRAVVYCS